MKILAIDDKKDNIISLRAIIKDLFPEAQFIASTDGPNGITLAVKENPDVILLDILMPSMDGYEVCEVLKKDTATNEIPVVFLTALKDNHEARIRALEVGGEGFLSKPVETPELMAQIRVMVQLKERRYIKRAEKEKLESLVQERTTELQHELNKRKKSEEELKLAKLKAEESDRLKSAFLANMSHEIRTPLNGIVGFLALLDDPELSYDLRKKYIEIINASSARLINTIDDIISISKIEANVVKVHNQETFPEKVILELIESFQLVASKKGTEINYKFDNHEPNFSFITDKNKLEGILINLINNAIKFTDNGEIVVGYEVEKKRIVFYVKDTGCGIDSDKLEIIFDRFRQGDTGMSRGYEGSGLGLSICKGYVNLLGGEIWVESSPGQGSTFFFSIKLKEVNKSNKVAKEKPKELSLNESNRNIGNGELILVVDDDQTSYDYLKITLEYLNFSVIHAGNGLEALTMLKSNEDIVAVLMDIKMPVMNGVDATIEIRKFDKNIPIIAQTAYAFSEEKKEALDAGCNDYISKPIIQEELITKLAQLLNNEIYC